MATRIGHDRRGKEEAIASGGREGGAGSRAREGGKRVLVKAATVRTTSEVAGGTTLNS